MMIHGSAVALKLNLTVPTCFQHGTYPFHGLEVDTLANVVSPISKNQMYSGTWTILILANNGAEDSFAAQRTFELTVGTQATVTYIPTGKLLKAI